MDEERIKRLEALLAIDERITALENAKGDRRPWWKNAGLIAAYGGLLTLVPAAITGVASWFESRRQLDLAAQQQAHERTLAYLGLAVDPDSTEAARAQVLRFLASLDGDPVSDWAGAELLLVQDKIDALVDEKAVMVADVVATNAAAQRVETQAAGLVAQAQKDPKLVEQAAAKVTEAEHLVAEVRRKRDRIDAISTRIGDTPIEILELRAADRASAKDAAREAQLENRPSLQRRLPSG
jgi:hypothetical protein